MLPFLIVGVIELADCRIQPQVLRLYAPDRPYPVVAQSQCIRRRREREAYLSRLPLPPRVSEAARICPSPSNCPARQRKGVAGCSAPTRASVRPSPSASQATPTPAACAKATSRSRLGSASPLSHLRNAEGETFVSRAGRSALGQCARIVGSGAARGGCRNGTASGQPACRTKAPVYSPSDLGIQHTTSRCRSDSAVTAAPGLGGYARIGVSCSYVMNMSASSPDPGHMRAAFSAGVTATMSDQTKVITKRRYADAQPLAQGHSTRPAQRSRAGQPV